MVDFNKLEKDLTGTMELADGSTINIDFNKHTKRLRDYKTELLRLHVAAEELLVMAELYKRPEVEITRLHEIIRKIIHVRD